MKAKRKSAGDNWVFDGSTITVRIPMTWKRHGGPQGNHRSRRQRCVGAGEAAARRDADPRAGAGASLEALARSPSAIN